MTPPGPKPSTPTPVNRLLDERCACGHVVDRHETGPTGRKGCLLVSCPCRRWYRVELGPGGPTLADGVVETPSTRKAS